MEVVHQRACSKRCRRPPRTEDPPRTWTAPWPANSKSTSTGLLSLTTTFDLNELPASLDVDRRSTNYRRGAALLCSCAAPPHVTPLPRAISVPNDLAGNPTEIPCCSSTSLFALHRRRFAKTPPPSRACVRAAVLLLPPTAGMRPAVRTDALDARGLRAPPCLVRQPPPRPLLAGIGGGHRTVPVL